MDSGHGSSVNFWTDNWLGYMIADKVEIPLNSRTGLTKKVSDFRSETGWIFGAHFAEEFPGICEDIVAVKIVTSAMDTLVWTGDKSGQITTKAAFECCWTPFPIVNWGSWIWASFIPPTRSMLLWRLVRGNLPTANVLASWGVAGPSICVFYRSNSETRDHMFSTCSFASAIIHKIAGFFILQLMSPLAFLTFFSKLLERNLARGR